MRECRFECESVDNAAARAVTALSQGPPPQVLTSTGGSLHHGQGKRDAGTVGNCGDECGGTAATEGAGGVRRDCCTAGEGLEQARGEFVAAMVKGWERGEVVNACDAAANGRERGCCDRCCTAANGRGGCCTGAQKGVCAAGCATAEGAVRAQGVYTRGALPEAVRRKWRRGAAVEPGESSQGQL